MLSDKRLSRGDTLIEVLFAVTVFSLVAVGSISIMNQGTAAAQRSLEVTLVRQQIDSQAEALRFLNASYVSAYSSGAVYPPNTPAAQWSQIRDYVKANSPEKTSSFGVCADSPPVGSFILNSNGAKLVKLDGDTYRPAETYSQVRYVNAESGSVRTVDKSEGIWIEAFVSESSDQQNQSNAGYIDFHIRACWDSPGLTVPMNLGTIVRLYEPRG